MKKEKKETFDINKFRLKLLVKPFEYKGMAVNVEQVGWVFKFNIYDPKAKLWYSHFVTDEDAIKGKCKTCGQDELVKKEYAPLEIAKTADVVVDMAKATIDLILKKDNPEELIEENQEAAAIVDGLEENIKLGKKELKDARNKKSRK